MNLKRKNAKGKVWIYLIMAMVIAGIAFGILLLLENIQQRKQEARQYSFHVVELTENDIEASKWGRNFPFQYDTYSRTVDMVRTKHGGSEAFGKLEADPRWITLFKGYAFGIDYREERGHAYMLEDQIMTRRVTEFPQVGACLHCHSAVIPAYKKVGKEAGVPDDQSAAQIMKGFEIVCGMPYHTAKELVSHPVTCLDCHNPETMQLRVTRPGFLNGIQKLAQSDYAVPQFPSIIRWRQGNRQQAYDVNLLADRQEMRSFVCGQCHVEYYFKGDGKLLTYPWHNGLKAEQAEKYYDQEYFKDWSHAISGAPLLKAQHPEFEMWSQGIHSRSGVACADCHMPYQRMGAVKISSHHVRSPLLSINSSCQTCHRFPESQLKERVENIQDKTTGLMIRAEEAVLDLIAAIKQAQESNIPPQQIAQARQFHRQAFWRLDYISAENSTGFHASQEAARILGEAIDYARMGVESLYNPELLKRAPAETSK